MTIRLRAALAAATALSLGACDLAKSEYLRPVVELPAYFRSLVQREPAAPATAIAPAPAPDPSEIWPAADWWTNFGSADLDRLVALAQAGNFDLAAAEARIRQAIAQNEISAAGLFPSLSASGNAQRQQSAPSSTTATRTGTVARPVWSNRFDMQLSTSYEIDFWGKNRAAADSAEASLAASRYNLATVALTTVSNVATA